MPFPHTLSTFRARHQEFIPTLDAAVQAALDAAELEIDANVWGDKALEGHGYLAAHKLGIGAFGKDARLGAFGDNAARTTYGDAHDKLARIVGTAYRVVLG